MKIIAPASSANLGPGFDSIGLAVNRYLEVTVGPASSTWQVDHNLPAISHGSDNLIIQAALTVVSSLPPHQIKVTSAIPLAHGLGSSSAAIVAGIELANQLAHLQLTAQEKIQLAAKIEGHPDNVAPAILGGIVVGTNIEDEFVAVKAPTPPYRLLAYVPPYNVVTAKARAVLPSQLPFSQAVHASAVANTLVAALFGQRYDVLGKLMEADEFHEQVRSALVPELSRIRKLGHESGAVATYLSGAGPTIMTLLPATQVSEFKKSLQASGLTASTLDLTIDQAGVRVVD